MYQYASVVYTPVMHSYHGRPTRLHRRVRKVVHLILKMCHYVPDQEIRYRYDKLSHLILRECYSDQFIAMLLEATLTDTGIATPHTRKLEQWLLTHIYSGDVRLMIDDWLSARSKHHATHSQK